MESKMKFYYIWLFLALTVYDYVHCLSIYGHVSHSATVNAVAYDSIVSWLKVWCSQWTIFPLSLVIARGRFIIRGLSTCIQIYQLVYKFINLYTNLSTCIQGDKYIYKFISRKYNYITLWFRFINWSVPISDKISHNTIDHDTVDYNFLVLNQDTAKSNPSYMTEINTCSLKIPPQ